MRTALACLLTLVLVTGCAKPADRPTTEPPAESPKESPKESPTPTAPQAAAWQMLLDEGSSDLFYAAPDGTGLIFGPSYDWRLYHVSLPERTVAELATRAYSFTVDHMLIPVRVVETPYGPLLVDKSPGLTSLSPDGQRVAIGRDGLWVADLATGDLRRVSSEPPAPSRPLHKHEAWDWAAFPSWSADGQWIDFYSNRLESGGYSLWRIPAGGGPEELVNRAAGPYGWTVLADGRVLRIEGEQVLIYLPDGGDPQVAATGVPGLASLSPDGRWVAAHDREHSLLVTLDLTTGQRREIPLPAGSGPELTDLWQGSRLLFRIRPSLYDLRAFLTVLDAASGSLTFYTPPEPTRGDLWPLGWTPDGRPLARLLSPMNDRAAPSGVWVLDPRLYTAPATAAPTRLESVHLRGPGPLWDQSQATGGVIGGSTEGRLGSHLLLQFDRPLDADWIRQAVQVEGKASLAVHGGPLGVAIIRVDGAEVGESVQVRVPDFNFALTLQIVKDED